MRWLLLALLPLLCAGDRPQRQNVYFPAGDCTTKIRAWAEVKWSFDYDRIVDLDSCHWIDAQVVWAHCVDDEGKPTSNWVRSKIGDTLVGKCAHAIR